MKKLLFLLACLFCFTAKPASFDPKNTYVFIGGVLTWKDSKSLPSFSNVHRKDEELKGQLIKMGVPAANVVMLLDGKATLKAMQMQVKTLSAKCNEKSTFIFYYAGHGVKRDEHFYFANYDMNVADCEKTGFDMAWLGNQLLQINKSGTIMLWADCCYSGGMLEQGKKIKAKGRNALVFSSATASNTSTGNWTFTQTLIDCLSNAPEHDMDRDGNMTDRDISLELKDAMKYREHQMNGYYSSMESPFVFVPNTGAKSIEKMAKLDAKDFFVGEYAYGFYENNWKPVRIITKNDYSCMVRFYFYSDYKDVELGLKQIKKIYLPVHNINDVVNVTWEGKKYEATILKAENDFYYIKYKGYEDSWNEWVMYDRIHNGSEKSAQIEEKGTWYPGEVLVEKDGKYFIHYNGYDFSWDEWVGPKRIKLE